MGILEKIKRLLKKDKPKMLDTGVFKFNMQNDERSVIEFRDIQGIYTVNHRNGSTNSLVQAKVYKYNEDNARLIDDIDYNYKYVTFEIPNEINLNGKMLKTIAEQYELYYLDTEEFCSFLGELSLTNKGFKITNISPTVYNYVKQNLEPKLVEELRQRREQRNQKIIGNEKINEQNEFLKRIDYREETNKYLKNQENIRNQRMKNPYLNKLHSFNNNGKIYSEWEGINTANGEVLKIHNLRKVGKAIENGQYLYTAIVNSTNSSNDANVINQQTGELQGKHIGFELPKNMEKMLENADANTINNILNLLTSGSMGENEEEFTYIGGIKQNGELEYTNIPSARSIENEFENIKKEYKEKIENIRKEQYEK